jgi:hypothetical protein
MIPRNRLKWIPRKLRLAHELCYHLHDEAARALVEAEACQADAVTINFPSRVTADQFSAIAEKEDTIAALRATGFPDEARRVILNRITMAMVSDCMHHLFEALRCFEKRKIIVAFNLLRKPLRDSLLYLSWMLGDEDDFYAKFSSGDPHFLSAKVVGNNRKSIFEKAIAKTNVADLIEADRLISIIYDRKNKIGLEGYFQHAVHLITVEHVELKTTPENFNFIFKKYSEDDVYHIAYAWLPYVLLFLSHVVVKLFDRMQALDEAGETAFVLRSKLAYLLSVGGKPAEFARSQLAECVQGTCDYCSAPVRITDTNARRILLSEQYRCWSCRRIAPFPISWMIQPSSTEAVHQTVRRRRQGAAAQSRRR